jgi:hypothetical protein
MRLGLLLLLLGFAPPVAAQTSHEIYAAQCVAQIEDMPDFSCGDGDLVPVTVNGIEITPGTFQSGMECDLPALLDNGSGSDGQCVPGSRILNLSSTVAQVSVMCRQKHNRPDGVLFYDEIDVIAYNPASGATCWFQAISHDPEVPVDGRLVRSPTAVDGPSIWEPPETVAADRCGNCHDNDPFMYSPFVGQVWRAVPSNPLGPYFHVDAGFGFDAWPTKTFDLRDNTCTGCHRIGSDKTCGELTDWMTGRTIPQGADALARRFPGSHSMSPLHGLTSAGWATFHGQSVAQITSCCDEPKQSFCKLTKIPAYRP